MPASAASGGSTGVAASVTSVVTSLAGTSMPELYTMAIFGIGALLVYIAPLVVIMGWEARQARLAQGVTTVAPYVMKAMVYSIGWTLLVTAFFVFPLIMVGDMDKANPVYGIWSFFHVDWLDPNVMKSLASSAGMTEDEKATAKAIAIIMMASRIAYVLLLIAFFFITFSFAGTITGMKYKSQNESMDFGMIGSFAITALTSIVAYQLILGVTSNTLQSTVEFAQAVGKVSGGDMASNPEFDVAKDIAIIVKTGMNVASSSL